MISVIGFKQEIACKQESSTSTDLFSIFFILPYVLFTFGFSTKQLESILYLTLCLINNPKIYSVTIDGKLNNGLRLLLTNIPGLQIKELDQGRPFTCTYCSHSFIGCLILN